MNRKAYFFLLDGLVAVMILLVGFMLISSANPKKPTLIYNTHLSEDLMNVLSRTRISDVCKSVSGGWDCDGDNTADSSGFGAAIDSGYVQNMNNTLFEGIIELAENLYWQEAHDSIKGFISDNNLIYEDAYGAAFVLEKNNHRYVLYNTVEPFPSSCFYSDYVYKLDDSGIEDAFNNDIDRDSIDIMISTKRVVMGNYFDGIDVKFWGPYVVEVWTWRR